MPRWVDLASGLRAAGLVVVEHSGWQTRGDPRFEPRGVVAHHTAIASTEASLRICINGRPDLPGPLAQVVLAPDGTCHVIAAARASHAGKGAWRGLSGNSSVWGVEAVHSGRAGDPWPAAQLAAYDRLAAALLGLAGAPADRLCAHREWTTRKIDPVGIDLDAMRARVAALLIRPSEEVRPVFEPALALPPIVDELAAPGGGVWLLGEDGGVFAFAGAPFLGAAAGQAYFAGRRAARLEPDDGGGYVVVATSGESYHYRA